MFWQNKQIKLLFFTKDSSEISSIDITRKRVIVYGSLFVTSLLALSLVVSFSLSSIYKDIRVNSLTQKYGLLKTTLQEMDITTEAIEQKIATLENLDDDLRIFVELPEINSDLRKLGIGGHDFKNDFRYSILESDISNKAEHINQILNNLEQRVNFMLESRNSINEKYQSNVVKLAHFPSVKPLLEGRVTDLFGYRQDPFTGKRKHHNGIDIAAPEGTNVLVTANGIVIEAKRKYSRNQPHGKVVTIDHGYGYLTRYAHLSKILVNKGDKVKRYDVIGRVGQTGRSTGPHLHYEVIQNGERLNPANHFYN